MTEKLLVFVCGLVGFGAVLGIEFISSFLIYRAVARTRAFDESVHKRDVV